MYTLQNIVCYDNLTIEILLGNLPVNIQKSYLEKTVQKLTDEDYTILEVYFSTNMSLKDTAETLFLHKNTVQYKLNRIHRITGFNPRSFQDAVVLFLAERLHKNIE